MEVLLQIIWVYPLAKGHFWILPLSTVPVACHTGWNSSPTLCPIWVGHCLQRSSFKMQTPPKEYNEVIISPVSSLLWIKLWAIFILWWKSNDPARRRVWGDVGSSRVLSGTNIGKMFKRLENTRQIWFSLQCSMGCFAFALSGSRLNFSYEDHSYSPTVFSMPASLQCGLCFWEPELEFLLGPLPSFIPWCSPESLTLHSWFSFYKN